MSAEREALTQAREALDVLYDEADNFSVSGVYFNEKCMEHKGLALAAKALGVIAALPDLDPAAEALRAAAPDLYEALSMLMGEVKDCKARGCPTNWYHLECWERARAALKKARAGVPDRKEAT